MARLPPLVEGDEKEFAAGLVPDGADVLDVGCGSGRVARALRPRARSYVGMELLESEAERARPVCGEVIVGSATAPLTWAALGGRKFGAILFIHVLEHLTEPEAALVLARQHLAPGGRLFVALPNVAIWRQRWQLLRGRWDYQDEGIMDRTHVCFYTFRAAVELLHRNGLQIQRSFLYATAPGGGSVRRGLVRLTRKLAPLLFAHSFLFELTPATSPESAA